MNKVKLLKEKAKRLGVYKRKPSLRKELERAKSEYLEKKQDFYLTIEAYKLEKTLDLQELDRRHALERVKLERLLEQSKYQYVESKKFHVEIMLKTLGVDPKKMERYLGLAPDSKKSVKSLPASPAID